MTESEFLSMLYLTNDAINSNFEFWLTGTFAVLIAFFFAGDRIFGYVKWTMLFIYLFGTLSVSLKALISVRRGFVVASQLTEMNSPLITESGGLAISSLGLQAIVLVFGAVATTYFVLNSEKYSKQGL